MNNMYIQNNNGQEIIDVKKLLDILDYRYMRADLVPIFQEIERYYDYNKALVFNSLFAYGVMEGKRQERAKKESPSAVTGTCKHKTQGQTLYDSSPP